MGPANSWFLSVTEIVNHMFIIFAFSLYNMPFFTPPHLLFYQRYSSEIYRKCYNGVANRDIFRGKCPFAMPGC